MTDALLPWSTPALHDLGPVSVAQFGGGLNTDGSTGSNSVPG